MQSTMKITEDGTQKQWRTPCHRLHRPISEGPAVVMNDGRMVWWENGRFVACYWPPVIKEDGLVHAWDFKGTVEQAKAELPQREITGPLYAAALMFM